ncbi:hypothetical protein [Streptomyces sp. 5-10]|uniref:hypothetical protein n=1 Tax=Streptomyces sp. 5-10 TaxID=878925 RepID=UPI00168A5806|nr:hypothetical protein [Streptomyces sp. 5-10]MBD3009162.1 hypothetical protein [Streptomyces sp. 5-10]
MSASLPNPEADWHRLQADTVHALRALLGQVENGQSPQDLFDSYLYAKPVMAEAMQARMRMNLPDKCDTFHRMRERLADEITRRYGQRIPEKYLRVPYFSRTHEELFSVLHQRLGESVPAPLLRVVTADSVHTERRTRELRELGFDIDATKENGGDVYTLRSLEMDLEMIPSIVKNNVQRDKKLPKSESNRLLSVIDSGGD